MAFTEELEKRWAQQLMEADDATFVQLLTEHLKRQEAYQSLSTYEHPAEEGFKVLSKLRQQLGMLSSPVREAILFKAAQGPMTTLSNIKALLRADETLRKWLPSIPEPEPFVQRFATQLLPASVGQELESSEEAWQAFLKLSEWPVKHPETIFNYLDSLHKNGLYYSTSTDFELLMDALFSTGPTAQARQIFIQAFSFYRTWGHKVFVEVAQNLSPQEQQELYFPLITVLSGAALSDTLVESFSYSTPSVVAYALGEKALETLGTFRGVLFLHELINTSKSVPPEAVWRYLESHKTYEAMPLSWWLPLVQGSFPTFEDPAAVPAAYGGVA